MRTVGHRTGTAPELSDQGALVRTAELLRGTAALVPRGVYRFATFEEADAWMTETVRRTRERLNPKTTEP